MRLRPSPFSNSLSRFFWLAGTKPYNITAKHRQVRFVVRSDKEEQSNERVPAKLTTSRTRRSGTRLQSGTPNDDFPSTGQLGTSTNESCFCSKTRLKPLGVQRAENESRWAGRRLGTVVAVQLLENVSDHGVTSRWLAAKTKLSPKQASLHHANSHGVVRPPQLSRED